MVQKLTILMVIVLFVCSCSQHNKYELVWSDEFDYTGFPDDLKWNFDTIGNSWGWGNNELQYYTSARKENAWVSDGKLVITARKEKGFPAQYTSARLTTKQSGNWLYGRVEVRAKVSKGTGLWPAVWMLPVGNKYGKWPHSGEIDIMEHVGYDPESIYYTVHTGAYNGMMQTQKTKKVYVPHAEESFCTYAVEWTDKKCDFFLDDKKVFSFKKLSDNTEYWPFNHPFYLILNVAVGGSWGGVQGVDDTIFPQTMEIDYVRVFQKK